MNWDAVSAVGQAVSALALIFVLGHAREEMRRATRQSRIEGSRELWLAQATHPELAGAIQRLWASSGGAPFPFVSNATAAGLTEADARQVMAFAWAAWHNFQGSIESADRLSPGVRDELDRTIRFNYGGTNPFAQWYESTRHRLNPDAVRYVDRVLAQPE